MILVFDLGGPLLAYSLLRSAGTSAVTALLISGVLPALGIVIGAVTDRRLDVIGVVVLAGLLVGTLLGLTSHNARLYLLGGSVPSAVFALGCLLSLRLRRPLIFRLALEVLGPDTRKGRGVAAAWRYPGLRRAFQAITVAWGVGYLAEAAIRVAIVATASTGIALICSKLVPLRLRDRLVRLDAGLRRAREEEGRTPGQHRYQYRYRHRRRRRRRRRDTTACPYKLVRCLAP